MIFITCTITLILLIFFKSDAFVEYSILFGLDKLFKIDKWEEFKNNVDVTVNYHTFLKLECQKTKYQRFFIKLITCPLCTCIWLHIPSIFIFGLINYPILVIITLFMYYIIAKIMN